MTDPINTDFQHISQRNIAAVKSKGIFITRRTTACLLIEVGKGVAMGPPVNRLTDGHD